MPKGTKAPWLLLSEAADLFCGAGNSWQAFRDLLTSGQARVAGKRGARLNSEPIGDLLRQAGQVSAMEVRFDAAGNRITVAVNIDPLTAVRLQYSDIDPSARHRLIRELDTLFPGQGSEMLDFRSAVSFAEVRVEWASLIDVAAAAGYTLANSGDTGDGKLVTAAREYVAQQYPEGIPAGITNKMLAVQYRRERKAPMSERTMRRARQPKQSAQ